MAINAKGELSRYDFFPAVICSKARLTYQTVWQLLTDEKSKLRETHAQIFPEIEALYHLYKKLRQAQVQRGAIEFETVESQFIFDGQRKIKKIIKSERNEAHRIIEVVHVNGECCGCAFIKTFKITGTLPSS